MKNQFLEYIPDYLTGKTPAMVTYTDNDLFEHSCFDKWKNMDGFIEFRYDYRNRCIMASVNYRDRIKCFLVGYTTAPLRNIPAYILT